MRTLLVHLHPRPDTVAIHRGRPVLVTGPDGMVAGGRHGLFVHQTRMLSRLRYRISGVEPFPVALSPVEQHRWLGYCVALPPERRSGGADGSRAGVGEAAQQALELRVWRAVGEGLHEDLDQDLADLHLDDLDRGTAAWILAAGLPDFVALFGRDALTAGWQAALLGPEMMRGAHCVLGGGGAERKVRGSTKGPRELPGVERPRR